MEKQEIVWLHKPEDNQFEVQVAGCFGMIEYEMMEDGIIDLYHTEVDNELEGKGVASVLVQKSLEYVKEQNLKFIPTCQFIASFIKRHPEWQHLACEA